MKIFTIILSAGKGSRFGESDVNKTAVNILGKSIIQRGVEKVESFSEKIIVVVGHKKESVINSISSDKVIFVEQKKQMGTGNAVEVALKYIKNNCSTLPDCLLIANGDHLFMIDSQYIKNAIKFHTKKRVDATILTTSSDDPQSFDNGRVQVDGGKVTKIIEKDEFTPEIRKINKLNTGTYIVNFESIDKSYRLTDIRWSGEIYINDYILNCGNVDTFTIPISKIGLGINTKIDLENFLLSFEKKVKLFNKSVKHRLVELFVLGTFLLVFLGKTLIFDHTGVSFLLLYGLIVTLVTWMTFVVAFKIYKDPYLVAKHKEKIHPKTHNYLVSCMVSVRNEEHNISKCIDSIIAQTYKNIEIIIVNDASTDNTLRILREYEKKGRISKLINLEQNVGKKRALGLAMRMANGSIFAHTDSDSIWARDAIEKMVKIFDHFPDVGAISGHGRALNGDTNLLTKSQDSWMEGQFSVRKAFESAFGSVSCVSGPLAVFRKEAIYNYIPAWENDTFLGQEFRFATDRTLTGLVLGSESIGNKIRNKYKHNSFVENLEYTNKEWQVVYTKSAKSWTIVPDSFSKYINQQIRWKKSFIRNIFFTGEFFWQKPLPVSFVYYAHIVMVLIGPFIAFRHIIYLPLSGNLFSGLLYILGIVFVGSMFGIAYKLEDKTSTRWMYRPLMSLLSTLIVSWLIFYSALTIKKMTWHRS